MDKLDVIRKTEELGGKARRSALENLIRKANKLGCELDVGGGRAGGINFRYGSIRYAIMDINVHGEVKLYVQPHPGKDAPEAVIDALNGLIKSDEALEPKSFPIASYGHLSGSLEDIPADSLSSYLDGAVDIIRRAYYSGSSPV